MWRMRNVADLLRARADLYSTARAPLLQWWASCSVPLTLAHRLNRKDTTVFLGEFSEHGTNLIP